MFTENQTKLVHENIKTLTTNEIRYEICNNINHKFGYGVLTGEKGALDFLKTSSFKVNKGDIIYLHTDGLNQIISKKNNSELVYLNPLKLVQEAEEYELLNPKIKSDDKSVIKIKIL